MAYRDNVQTLCDKLGLPNPICEEDLEISMLTFRDNREGPGRLKFYDVEANDMNRAGRLFLQSSPAFTSENFYLGAMRREAAEFFTPALWDDCSSEKRPLVWGIKTCPYVEIIKK